MSAAGSEREASLCVAMLFSSYPPEYTGAGAQGERLARSLAESGVRVEVLCPAPRKGSAPRSETAGRLRVRRFGGLSFDSRRLLFGLQAAFWLLSHRGWSVLHLHGFNYWSLLPCLVAWASRKPVLVKTTLLFEGADGALSGRLRLPQRAIVAAYSRVDAIVALSDALAQSFEQAQGYRARILRIPNGVDTERFRPAQPAERLAARDRFALPPDATVIVTVGRLEARKNVVSLVEAAAGLGGRGAPVCLLLVGPPSPVAADREALDRAVSALPDFVRAHFTGALPPVELPEALWAADILVLSSRAEGMPNSLLEGMASGLACLATDIPGSRDVLKRGGGVLVALDDRAAMTDQLDAWIDDADERRRIGTEARLRIEAEYSIRSVAERYRAAYRDLLGEG